MRVRISEIKKRCLCILGALIGSSIGMLMAYDPEGMDGVVECEWIDRSLFEKFC